MWPPRGRGRSAGLRVAAAMRGRSPALHVATVEAWPYPGVSCGRRGGVGVAQDFLWPPWGRGRSSVLRAAAAGAWPVTWASCGRREGVAGPQVFVIPPWGRARSPVLRSAAVGAWPFPWASCGRRGSVGGPLCIVWPPWGVAGPLGFVWPPWGVAVPVCFVWPPWERGRSPAFCVAAMGAWPVPCASCGRRGDVAGHLGFVWLPWGVAGPQGFVWPPWRRDGSPVVRVAAVGVWPLPWASCRICEGVAVPYASCGCRGAWPVPLA